VAVVALRRRMFGSLEATVQLGVKFLSYDGAASDGLSDTSQADAFSFLTISLAAAPDELPAGR
jgi:hypothetical protein